MNKPTSRDEAKTVFFVTPCCGTQPYIGLRFEGPAYMQSEVVDTIECFTCGNSWHADGSPSQIHTEPTDPSYPGETSRSEFFDHGEVSREHARTQGSVFETILGALTEGAQKHWEAAEQDREKSSDRGCACELCATMIAAREATR